MFAACTNFVPQPTMHVIPAPAGIQFWTPAFPGVTRRRPPTVPRAEPGEFIGMTPTGKRVSMSGMIISRIVAGKIVAEKDE